MIYPIYSVRDLKGDFYAPRIEQNEGSAIRWFSMTVNTPETLTNFAPADFQLYYIGTFESDTGLITPIELPQFIISGSSVYGKE